MQKHTFTKEERLKSRKEISRLFSRQGHSFGQYPLRLVWIEMEERRSSFPVQFSVSVPKKKFKKAVSRNRIRRLIHEAYRLNKETAFDFLPADGPQIAWMVLFVGDEEISLAKTQKCVQKMIRRFQREWVSRQKRGTSTNDRRV